MAAISSLGARPLAFMLIISAVLKFVIMIGARSGRCNWAAFSAASRSWEPSTVRCGFMKSLIAEPSRKNSGQETTAKGIRVFWC